MQSVDVDFADQSTVLAQNLVPANGITQTITSQQKNTEEEARDRQPDAKEHCGRCNLGAGCQIFEIQILKFELKTHGVVEGSPKTRSREILSINTKDSLFSHMFFHCFPARATDTSSGTDGRGHRQLEPRVAVRVPESRSQCSDSDSEHVR